MMKTQVIEGSRQQIAEQVLRIDGHIAKAVVYLDDPADVARSPRLSDQQFEKLMAEAQADTVAVGHMDDSREAIYTRMEGE